MTDAERRDLNRQVAICVMGDDLTANTPGRRKSAMWDKVSVYDNGEGMRVAVRMPGARAWSEASTIPYDHDHPGGRAVCRTDWVWMNRKGQPWREWIERHVRDWRAEPPDYAGDAKQWESLLNWLRDKCYGVQLSWHPTAGYWCRAYDESQVDEADGNGDSWGEAICRAALAAVREHVHANA